jgi:hypothetical protein
VNTSQSTAALDPRATRLLDPYADLLQQIHQQLLPQQIPRHRWFFTAPGRGRLLIQVHPSLPCDVQITPLSQADPAADLPHLVAQQAGAFLARWQGRGHLDDDALPCTYFFTGIAEQAAFLGGSVAVDDRTSWVQPFLLDLTDPSLVRVHIDPNRLWAHFPLEAIRLLVRFGIPTGPRGLFGPFDLACAVRGHDFLTDLVDEPHAARRLLQQTTDAAAWWARRQLTAAGQVDNGTILPYFKLWLPGEVAGHVSADHAVMISPALVEQFALPYEQQFAHRFEGAAYHLHNVGWQLIRPIRQIANLKMLEITDDPASPRTATRYLDLLEICGDLPVMIYPRPDELYDQIDLLAGHNVIISMTADNLGRDRPLQLAGDLIKLVRDRCKLPPL